MQCKPIHLFLIVILFYAVSMVALKPHWVLDGEMWAEMGSNYYANAVGPSYFYKFFATDAGYIPVTPRLIALIGYYLHIPVPYIPYFYTWTGMLLSAMLVGSFCLTPFRTLIQNDTIRFMTCLIILWVVDFETRTFINFSYFGGFYAAIITALALYDRENDVPKWAWFIPILVISKPGVLAVLPIMLLTACFSKPRFRWITIVTTVLCVAQMIQILHSAHLGVYGNVNDHNSDVFTKVIVSIQYFFGFLSSYLFDLDYNPWYHHIMPMSLGLLISIVCLYHCYKKRNGASALIVVGLSMFYFNIFINCFAASAVWNEDLHLMKGSIIYRHIIVGFQGVILVAIAFLSTLTDASWLKTKRLNATQLTICIMLGYFIATGLVQRGFKLNKKKHSPVTHNSHWQAMSTEIEQNPPHLCVPVDPAGWTYPSQCAIGNTMIATLGHTEHYHPVTHITPAADIQNETITGFALLVRTIKNKKTMLTAHATLHLKNGHTIVLTDEKTLYRKGGLVLFQGKERVRVNEIASVTLSYSEPSEVACKENGNPLIMWLP